MAGHLSKTSSLNAIKNSYPRRVGVVPYWVDHYDEVVYFDMTSQVVRCRHCKDEVKNLGWAKEHMRRCFGIQG